MSDMHQHAPVLSVALVHIYFAKYMVPNVFLTYLPIHLSHSVVLVHKNNPENFEKWSMMQGAYNIWLTSHTCVTYHLYWKDTCSRSLFLLFKGATCIYQDISLYSCRYVHLCMCTWICTHKQLLTHTGYIQGLDWILRYWCCASSTCDVSSHSQHYNRPSV